VEDIGPPTNKVVHPVLAHSLRYLERLRDRLIDLIVLALVATLCMAWAYHLLGVRHQGLLVIFVVTWLASAAKRFSDFRRGVYSPLKAYGKSGSTMPTIVAGTCPWIVLVFFYKAYPASFVWTSGSLPVWLNLIGVALAVVTLARPGVVSINGESNSSSLFVPQLTVRAQILALAMLLMSGSLVIVLVLSVWLLMLQGGAHRPHSPRVTLSLLRMNLEELRLQTIKSP
jgi:hypothetical protein